MENLAKIHVRRKALTPQHKEPVDEKKKQFFKSMQSLQSQKNENQSANSKNYKTNILYPPGQLHFTKVFMLLLLLFLEGFYCFFLVFYSFVLLFLICSGGKHTFSHGFHRFRHEVNDFLVVFIGSAGRPWLCLWFVRKPMQLHTNDLMKLLQCYAIRCQT